MPRIKNLTSQQLYKISKDSHYEVFDCLLSKSISLALSQKWEKIPFIIHMYLFISGLKPKMG